MARFEREAKAIAALDHPGIVTIHAVENIEGRLKVLDFGLAKLGGDIWLLEGIASAR